jgi:hypothetical protein
MKGSVQNHSKIFEFSEKNAVGINNNKAAQADFEQEVLHEDVSMVGSSGV